MNNTATTYHIGQAVVDIESGIVGEVIEVTTEGVKIVTGTNRRPSWMSPGEIRPTAQVYANCRVPNCGGVAYCEYCAAQAEADRDFAEAMRIYGEGHKACVEGKQISANPYRTAYIEMDRAWRNGWKDARYNSCTRGMNPTREYTEPL